MNEITMPSLSDSMQEGTILSWFKADGERVEAGEELLEIETDKATMAYESPVAGVVRIVAAVGETLPVGAVIAHVGEGVPDSDLPAAPAAGDPVRAQAEPVPVSAAPSEGNGADPAAVRATPLARRLADAHGVDLQTVKGTGPRGRITRSDVAAMAQVPDRVVSVPSAAPLLRLEGETQELTRTQQLIARRMSESKATVPHFQVQTEAQMDALIALRTELKALGEQAEPVPSVNDFIVKAAALALARSSTRQRLLSRRPLSAARADQRRHRRRRSRGADRSDDHRRRSAAAA